MKRYRIHKDITNRLKVTTNKEEVALAGRDITVHLVDPKGCAITMSTTIVDDVKLEFVYYGTQHKLLGTYRVVVWENYMKVGMTAVDCLDAFRLVPYTTMEGGEDPEGLDTEVNELELDLSTGVRGADGVGIDNIKFNADYTMTITLTDGTTYTSPVLRGETGPQGPQGPAGENSTFIYTIDASGIFQTGTKNIQGSEAYNAILAAYNAGKSVFLKLDGEEFKQILPLNTILQYTGGTIDNFEFTMSVSTPSGTIAYIDAQIFPNYSLLTYSFGYNVMGNDTIRNVISISEAAYNALATKDSSTLYVITEQ